MWIWDSQKLAVKQAQIEAILREKLYQKYIGQDQPNDGKERYTLFISGMPQMVISTIANNADRMPSICIRPTCSFRISQANSTVAPG